MTTTIEKLASQVGLALLQRGLLLATAESCTGGGLAYWITHVPHSSNWFERGFITYSNPAKIEQLGVSELALATFGAVSELTAREMAEGVLENSHADLSIAITGIAGPSGGSAEKPVGTVWLAWASRHHSTVTQLSLFTGNREAIRTQAIEKALSGLLPIIERN